MDFFTDIFILIVILFIPYKRKKGLYNLWPWIKSLISHILAKNGNLHNSLITGDGANLITINISYIQYTCIVSQILLLTFWLWSRPKFYIFFTKTWYYISSLWQDVEMLQWIMHVQWSFYPLVRAFFKVLIMLKWPFDPSQFFALSSTVM